MLSSRFSEVVEVEEESSSVVEVFVVSGFGWFLLLLLFAGKGVRALAAAESAPVPLR